MGDLAVHLYGKPIGVLVGTDWRSFDFRTTDETFENFELLSTILSESIPLQPAFKRRFAPKRRNFFTELLPEGPALEQLARQSRVPPQDTIGLLRRYGRDVAGAVEIFDPESDFEPPRPELRTLSAEDIGRLARKQAESPLGNDPIRGRISLGGFQTKFTLTSKNNVWYQPLGGYPSTHIIKPPSADYPTIIFDEEYGTRIARHLGLLGYQTSIESFDGVECLVIQRYDRDTASDPPARIHQEDMNQALGTSGIQKYQEHGGAMSLSRIAGLLAGTTTTGPTQLLRQITLAAGIGNLDMHGKNISLIHLPDGSVQLAPAYDVVPMLHQPIDGRLALKINGVYPIRMLKADDLITEGEHWGVADAAAIVETELAAIADFVRLEQPHPKAYPQLQEEIAANVSRLLRR
jgi:serine/threonine-protein kinase HipA